MKKILCLFSALALVVSSCSSDDSSSDSNNDSVLLKKTITTYSDGSKNTKNYTYNGNKLVSIVEDSGDSNEYYTYTGDLITKIDYKYPDGTLDQVNTYTYNAEKQLVTFVRIDPEMDWGDKETYTYNADGSIIVKSYIGDGKTQTQLNSTGTVKFANGEVIEMIDSINGDYTYTYDAKNNPLKNVAGWNKINFTDGDAIDVLYNMLTEKIKGKLSYNFTYTYNENGFPTKSIESVEKETVEFFY